MLRGVLTFCSLLALGIVTAVSGLTLLPWLSGRVPTDPASGLQLESLIAGLMLGLTLGTISRFHWADIPRRVVTWFIIRERQFFYYTLILGCIAVLCFY